jgi:hypothetical protein
VNIINLNKEKKGSEKVGRISMYENEKMFCTLCVKFPDLTSHGRSAMEANEANTSLLKRQV